MHLCRRQRPRLFFVGFAKPAVSDARAYFSNNQRLLLDSYSHQNGICRRDLEPATSSTVKPMLSLPKNGDS